MREGTFATGERYRRPDYLDDLTPGNPLLTSDDSLRETSDVSSPGVQFAGPVLRQVVPIILAAVIFLLLAVGMRDFLGFTNELKLGEGVVLQLRLADILIGLTIYLKTSVDFAIFMGRLMERYPGWLNRIAIETGTAVGNAVGTVIVLIIWLAFKEVDILLALMILFASMVLFELAYAGLEHFANWQGEEGVRAFLYNALERPLAAIVRVQQPFLSKILPDLGQKFRGVEGLGWGGLLRFSFTIPFILGMDDFAGYVPLFSIVNIYGFAVGVFLAHAMLNIFLFLSPRITIAVVRNEVISFLGSLAFVGLALFGLWEVVRIVLLG